MEASKYFHNDTPWNWNKTDPRRLIFLFYLRRYFLSLSFSLFRQFFHLSSHSLLPFLFLSFSFLVLSTKETIQVSTKIVERIVLRLDSAYSTSRTEERVFLTIRRERRAREARRFIDMLLLFDLGHLEFEFRPSTMIISRVGNGRGMNDWVKRA